MRISCLLLLVLPFLISSQQSNIDFGGCDLDHPYRLITRMSGKAIYALATSEPTVCYLLLF